jgi:hypothetical protein
MDNAMNCLAAIANGRGSFSLDEIEVTDPRPGERLRRYPRAPLRNHLLAVDAWFVGRRRRR